ncbi:MAG: 2-hydroxyacyl-CoA dehydratase family protein [Caldiserica bacterium]|jgi:benzoyl-CoA reductase/2-hydroxyglutaryl-CoA dehydratase subunit BcrC/BadD/HgdB|nr:2-hydroxyacyl-CoA dehydratase family protein [Caldisericota bacterium]
MSKALWNCSYLPLELPLAFEFMPVRMTGKTGTTPRADRFLPVNLCSYARSFLEESLLMKDESVFLLADCCDSVRRLADALEHEFPGKVFLLFLPRSQDNWEFFREELRRLQGFLSQLKGTSLKDGQILEATEIVAQRRERFREWEALKREGLIRPLDYFHALQALNDFSQDLEPVKVSPSGGAKVFLLGTNLDDEEVWEIFEELELRIVGDDLCYGEKQGEISCGFSRGDPLEPLALSYLSRPPCPRMRNLEERFSDLLQKIEERKVDGVLLFPTKYCDSFFYDLPLLHDMLRERGIPFVVLEQDYSQRPAEQLRTRIEAMLEKK